MQIEFYKSASNIIKVDKVFTNKITKSATLKGQVNILNPVLVLNYDSSIINHNYVYIPEWGRYYRIVSKDVNIAQEMTITLHNDVRVNQATLIRNSTARVTRSASNYDVMIPDKMIINKVNNKITQRKIGNGFTRANKYYVLIGG